MGGAMMTNELNIPIGGVGPEGAFDVECLGRNFTIRYIVNMRSGATNGMIISTIKHFKHAIQCLAIGSKEPNSTVGERSVYNEPIEHDESRANVWTFRSFAVVPIGDSIFKVPINLCNEFTSASVLINWVWFAVSIMDSEELVDDFIKAGSIIEALPKPQSELDKHFGERPAAPKNTNESGAVTTPKNIVGERPVFDFLSKDMREEIETTMSGQVIGLRVGAIERKEHVWDDGNKEEQIMFWPQDSEYPYNYRTVIKVDDRENNYDLKVVKKAGLLEQLPQAGYKIPLTGIAYYKINKGKGNYADKVFWNLHSYVAVEAPSPQAQDSEELQPPPIDYDEIPF